MPWIGASFLTGHLMITQFARLSSEPPRSYMVHIALPQMILVSKLMAFCWNVHDGRIPDTTLSSFQKDRKITASIFPTPLEFLSYALFFPTMFYGPALDYSDYRSFINLSMFDTSSSRNTEKSSKKPYFEGKIPSCTWVAFHKIMAGLLWTFLFFKLAGLCPLDLLLSQQFNEYSFARRILLVHIFAFTLRINHYGVWALTEASCIISGIGYNGLEENSKSPRWDRMRNVNALSIELAQSPHAYIGNWNLNTCNWLKNYVYLRVTRKGQKPGFQASMITFFYSALWHGFAPGYYVTFVLTGILQKIAKGT